MPLDLRAFPPPSTCTAVDAAVVRQTPVAGAPVVLTAPADAEVKPTRWSVTWQARPESVGVLVLAHYREALNAAWPWLPPGAAAPVQVRYVAPPETRWHGGRFSGSATLETATAY